ncbi:MAG: hypothetical protein DWH84_05505 [Planctomycetota bacterium]|nr:MAG: hypothetical protein DWH84_05505 [Planctomycetota bacterium]
MSEERLFDFLDDTSAPSLTLRVDVIGSRDFVSLPPTSTFGVPLHAQTWDRMIGRAVDRSKHRLEGGRANAFLRLDGLLRLGNLGTAH